MSGTCCEVGASRTAASVNGGLSVVGVLIPGALLAVLPKCPVCIAAYVAMWTGLGLSVSSAAYVRVTLAIVCVVSLVYFGAVGGRRILRWTRGRHGD
jgi:hypothetical protein